VDEADFSAAVKRLQGAKVECWQENRSPGASYYFLDPNGHKLEIHVSDLDARVKTLKDAPPRDLIVF